jgi:hypothetical protein
LAESGGEEKTGALTSVGRVVDIPAKPNMTVVSAYKSGFYWGSRSEPPYRKYDVLLESPTGVQKRRVVGVSVGIFDNGSVRDFSKSGQI